MPKQGLAEDDRAIGDELVARVSARVTFEEGREGRVPVAVREQDLVGRVHHVGVEVCGQAAPVQGRLGRQGRETCGCRRGVHVPPMGAWVGATDTRRLTLTGIMAWICGGASSREAPGTQGVATLPDPWRLASVMRWVSSQGARVPERGDEPVHWRMTRQKTVLVDDHSVRHLDATEGARIVGRDFTLILPSVEAVLDDAVVTV